MCCILSPFMGELQWYADGHLHEVAVSYPPLWGNYNIFTVRLFAIVAVSYPPLWGNYNTTTQ